MYYKIENKDSKVYKELHELRTRELRIEEENLKAIEKETDLQFDEFFGSTGQENFRRVSTYVGFKFTEPEKVDRKIWKRHPTQSRFYVPNKRTKLGKEMSAFLSYGISSSRYSHVWDILDLDHLDKFTFPFVEIVGDLILLHLDDKQDPKDENVIEITKKGFDLLFKD